MLFWSGMAKKQITVTEELRDRLKSLTVSLGPLRFTGGLSQQNVIELAIAWTFKVKPPPADFIRDFKFQSRRPGRPRRPRLIFHPQPTVREQQLGSSETKANDQAD